MHTGCQVVHVVRALLIEQTTNARHVVAVVLLLIVPACLQGPLTGRAAAHLSLSSPRNSP